MPGSETNAQFKTKGNTSGSFKAGTNNYYFGAGQLGLEHRFSRAECQCLYDSALGIWKN